MTVNSNRQDIPAINLMGSGRITPVVEGLLPNVTAEELSDCEFGGTVTISGTHVKHLLIQNANIGDVELRFEGSYEKVAFVNCKFDDKAVVTILENDEHPNREILLMGCEYSAPEGELLLIEDDSGNLDWKTENLWVYDDIVPEQELDSIRAYLKGEIADSFDEDYDMYGIDSDLDEEEETEQEEEEESDLGWKVSLATLGVAAIFGLAGKKAKEKKVKEKKVKNVRKRVEQRAAAG